MKSSKAFTLIEVLVALLIISIGIVSILLFLTRSLAALQFSSDTIEATSHAEFIFEEMRSRPTLANIEATDWNAFVQSESLFTLPSESMNVWIINPGGDPLRVKTTIDWNRNARQSEIYLTTQITKW